MADYHLARGGQKLGIYPEDRIREYWSQGRVAPDDLLWSPGMDQWRPAHEVLTAAQPAPPSLHWGWVLLLTVVTFGLFYIVWAFVQAVWVRRVDKRSWAIAWLLGYLALSIAGESIAAAAPRESTQALAGTLVSLVGVAAFIFAAFSIRRSLQAWDARIDPPGLRLSRVMTFLFNVFYFQYHFTRIARRVKVAAQPT